jgi:EF hand
MRLAFPAVMALIIGVAAGFTAPIAGAQPLPSSCEGGAEGAVSAEDTGSRAEERFDLMRQRARGRDQQVPAASTGADGLCQQFIQVDEDGDGRISRDEWLRWFGPAHAGATVGAGSRYSGVD